MQYEGKELRKPKLFCQTKRGQSSEHLSFNTVCYDTTIFMYTQALLRTSWPSYKYMHFFSFEINTDKSAIRGQGANIL